MTRAVTGDDVRVNAHTIEKRLADIWREEQEEERAVTRAALWNVVAHTWNGEEQARASSVLGRASASVPQRTIVIRADPRGAGDMSSWISANCHLIGGGGQQVCSEEVSIVASGDRMQHVPPLVASLLLPDMPVAVWWIGDLPHREHHEYVETLLEPADRLIVDSSTFDSMEDFDLIGRIAEETTTAPADLCWARIEEWRAATAMLFDAPSMRARLGRISRVHVTGARSEATLYLAWMRAQLGAGTPAALESGASGIAAVEIQFDDGRVARIHSERERGVVVGNIDGTEHAVECLTRALGRGEEDLIVRLLKRPEADSVYLKTLRCVREIA
jgi:glucose-6-phosphate dehydrogenase assembly protein OpcA